MKQEGKKVLFFDRTALDAYLNEKDDPFFLSC